MRSVMETGSGRTARKGLVLLSWRLRSLLAVVATSCTLDPILEERSVVVYSPRACPVSESEAYSVLYAGGDFEPSPDRPPIASVYLRELGRTMEDLPKGTRALLVDVSQKNLDWRGLADVPATGPTNVLVWPGGASCPLTQDVERRTDSALAVFDHHLMVTGGRSLDGGRVPNTFVGDLTTGALERLAFGLRTRRSHPSVTSFRPPGADGTGADGAVAALVAGGEDPESRVSIATAEVYVPKAGVRGEVGDFIQQRIDLTEARTDHGAVVLNGGETLLVGGRGTSGPLRTMEVVNPVTQRSRSSGVALLRVARTKPMAMRLASGEILVAGGIDASNEPVATLEWFAPDASRAIKRPVDLVTGRERAIVPLEGGGALAVVIPATPIPDFKTVWVISADGSVEPAVPLDPTTIDVVRLFPGAKGGPVLWTGRQWLRWSPWLGSFSPIAGAPTTGPMLDAIASGDPGLALWLEDRGDAGMNVTGYRFDARSRFDAVAKSLLLGGPEQLAPDRLAGFPSSSIAFVPDRGLILGSGASAFLTDLTFTDVEINVDVSLPRAGASEDVLANVVLRQDDGVELEVGGAGCGFAQPTSHSLRVRRSGGVVEVSSDGGASRTCPTKTDPRMRVAVGLRGPQGVVVSGARNLRVVRR